MEEDVEITGRDEKRLGSLLCSTEFALWGLYLNVVSLKIAQ